MSITFLGTGTSQGIPVIGCDDPVCLSSDPRDKRLRVSVLLAWDHYRYVIDCGPDFREQMLSQEMKRLDGILFTHEHSDHIAGLDDIRPFFFRQGDIPIYAKKRVVDALRKRFDYIFTDKDRYPGAPAVAVNYVERDRDFWIGGKRVVPIEAQHSRIDVMGYRIDGFTYLTDVKTIEADQMAKISGSDILVINALRHEPHHGHFNLREALEFIEAIKPRKAYLTHISHLLGFHAEVEERLPKNVHLAYDNLRIIL